MEPVRLTLLRYESGPAGTFGVLLCGREWICHTLEPASRAGGYRQAVPFEYSPKFRRQLPTISAPGRVGLRVHAGNKVSETSGCILVGESRSGPLLLRSKVTLERVVDIIKERDIRELSVIDYESISDRP